MTTPDQELQPGSPGAPPPSTPAPDAGFTLDAGGGAEVTPKPTSEGQAPGPDGQTGGQSAPATPGTPEFINQEAVNTAINKQHEKYRNEERQHQETLARLQAAEQKLQAMAPAAPTIPQFPDQMDPDFETKKVAYTQAVEANASYIANQAAEAERTRLAQTSAQQAEQTRINNIAQQYNANVVKANIDPALQQQREQTVAAYRLNPQVLQYVLGHENGPAIVHYLGGDVLALQQVATMNPVAAAAHIAAKIVPLAASARITQSRTPAPPTDIPGGGSAGSDSPALRGVVWE